MKSVTWEIKKITGMFSAEIYMNTNKPDVIMV
jgi:hypothetical protein